MNLFMATVTRNFDRDYPDYRGRIKIRSEQLGIGGSEESVHWITPLTITQGLGLPAMPAEGATVILLAETDAYGDIDWDHMWWMHPPMNVDEACPDELKSYYPDVGWWSVDGNLVAASSKGGGKFLLWRGRGGKGFLATGDRVYMGTIPDLSGGLAAAVATMAASKRQVALFLTTSTTVGSTVLFSD